MLNSKAAQITAVIAGVVFGVFFLGAFPGCQWGIGFASPAAISKVAAVSSGDRLLAVRVKVALMLSPVSSSKDLAVDVIGKAVLLSGTLPSYAQIELTHRVVSNVSGVTNVESIVRAQQEYATPELARSEPLDVGVARQSFLRHGTLLQVPVSESSETAFLQSPISLEVVEAERIAGLSTARYLTRVRAALFGVLGIASVYDELLIEH